MAARVTATVRIYHLNGTFVPQEPGEDRASQQAFREHVGDLADKLLRCAIGVYDVQVMNDQVRVYYLPRRITARTLDERISRELAGAYVDGLISAPPKVKGWRTAVGRNALIKRITETTDQLTRQRQIDRFEAAETFAACVADLKK